MTFKTIAFMTVLVSAVAMGACGKSDSFGAKDTKLAGSCTYTRADGVLLCEQLNLASTAAGSDVDKAADGMKADCAAVTGSKYSSSGCSKDNALGGCRGTDGVTTIGYKGGILTSADQIRAQCGNQEFVQP